MDFTDYNIRIFGNDDVSIHGDNILYRETTSLIGMQCNFEGEEYKEFLKMCKQIRENILKLNQLVKDK